MGDSRFEIGPCPPELARDAMSLVLRAIAPEQRREVVQGAGGFSDATGLATGALCIAQRDGVVRGAAWGQLQAGNTAVLWPPEWDDEVEVDGSLELVRAVVSRLDALGVAMTQTLLPGRDVEVVPALEGAGFRHLADLVYLTSEAAAYPTEAPICDAIELEVYQLSERRRLGALVERTYEGTLDCAGLEGARQIDDVLDGYATTGVTGNSHWYIVRARERDVGVLLLAEHLTPRHWELMYVGLVPDARRQGLGVQVTQTAQWLAKQAQVERIVLAVDAANPPALKMYDRCGFVVWDRRSVYVRINDSRTQESFVV